MQSKFTLTRTSAEFVRAVFPPAPTHVVRQGINRAIQLLRMRDRWRYVPAALWVVALGLTCLFSGILLRSDLLVLLAFSCLVGAGFLCLRLAPGQLEIQVSQTERDTEKLQCDYATQCRKAADAFSGQQRASLDAAAAGAVRQGASLAEVRSGLGEAEQELQASGKPLAAELDKHRALVKQRREEYSRQRARLSAAIKDWRALLLPSLGRGVARDALDALFKLSETACEEISLHQASCLINNMAEAVAVLSRSYTSVVAPGSCVGTGDGPLSHEVNGKELLPYWLGVPLPPAELVRAGAVDKAKLHLRSFRESLVKGAAGRPANELIEEALKDLFSADLPWATTIETYVGSLNGETAFFADRLCKEAAEWPPSNPMPGRDRHRKFFVLATGGANSAACKALKERLPGAVGVVGLEHIGDDLLVVAEERNVVLAELPEACACIDAFRALPAEKQALLVTAVEDASHVIDYRPDSAEDRDRPGRLLACALALGIVTRLSSQDYRFGSQLFAKGFRAAVVALALDQRLAGFLAAKVEEAVSRDGSAAVATKLKSAHEQPSLFVPKDAAGEFQGALEAATCELDRRAVAASRVQ